MLTILSYKTHKDHLIFHLDNYQVINVNVGDNFEATISSSGFPKTMLFHINLSNYRSFFSDTNDPHAFARKFGIRVLNYGLYDISKKTIQQVLIGLGLPSTNITKGCNADEKVILKSDFNFGAYHERALSPAELKQLGIDCDFSKVPWCRDYRVLKARGVPEHTWTQAGVVIEKFIENDEDTYIRIFKYFNRYVLVNLKVPGNDIKKMSDSRDRKRIYCEQEQIPFITEEFKDALKVGDKFFSGLNIDFGAVDMMTDNNGVNYIVDFNDTPFWGRPYWGAGNETKLISYLSKNKISVKYTARKTFNSMRSLVGL